MPASLRDSWNALCMNMNDLMQDLQLPEAQAYGRAWQQAGRDGAAAMHSITRVIWWTLRPMVLLVVITTRALVLLLYEHVIVKGILQHGGAQASQLITRWWRWQITLNAQQLALELGAMLLLFLCYKALRFCQQRRYSTRFAVWKHRQVLQVQKLYHRCVGTIATTSLWLAVMTPHAIYWGAVVAAKVALPRAVQYLACHTSLLALLRTVYPTVATFLLVQEGQQQQEASTNENASPPGSPSKDAAHKKAARPSSSAQQRTPLSNSNKKATKTTTPGLFARTHPSSSTPLLNRRRRRRNSIQAPLQHMLHEPTSTLEQDVQFWRDFWLVYAVLAMNQYVLQSIPFVSHLLWRNKTSWLMDWSMQLELAFWVWVFVVPYMVPTHVGNTALPPGQPLQLLSQWCRPLVQAVHGRVSSIVSQETWHTYVVTKVTALLNVCVMVKLLSESNVEALTQTLEHGQGLLVPGITLAMPSPVTQWGIWYVQYVLPLRAPPPSSSQQRHDQLPRNGPSRHDMLELQYWVLHVLLSTVLGQFANILWWIPFSTHALLVLWAYASLPRTIARWYGTLVHELEHLRSFVGTAVGVDSSDDVKDRDAAINRSQTAQLIAWLIDILPKASADDYNDAGAANDSNDAGFNGSPSMTSARAAADDIDPPPEDAGKRQQRRAIRPNAGSKARRRGGGGSGGGSFALSDLSEIDEDADGDVKMYSTNDDHDGYLDEQYWTPPAEGTAWMAYNALGVMRTPRGLRRSARLRDN